MQIEITLTEREKEFLKTLVENGSRYTYSRDYDKFREDWNKEIDTFMDSGLIYHYNHANYNAFIAIGLNYKGKELADNNGITGAKSF